jgi:hypothetical protein
MRQHQNGDLAIQRLRQTRRRHLSQHMPTLQQRGEALRHVEIGGEISVLGQNHRPARTPIQRRSEQLEQIDRGGISGHRRAWCGADESSDFLADAELQVDPAVICPTSDQRMPPLLLHHLGHARRRRLRQRAERIAVEIDHAIGQHEAVAERREFVGAIQRLGFVARQLSRPFAARRRPSCRRPPPACGR